MEQVWNHGQDKNKRFRGGKTRKDKLSGKHSRTIFNRERRGLWSNGTEKDFPLDTLGGKGNSTCKPFKMVQGRGRVQ